MSNKGFKQAFNFPPDIFRFGKHSGKQIDFVIDNDRMYYNWLLSEGLRVSEIITDYAKGLDVVTESITYQVNKKTDILTIRSVKHYILPKLKFIRGKDFRKHISDTVIAEHKIEIPFTETTSERTEYRDYTKFHCDCEEVTVITTTKTYEELAFRMFLEDKLSVHKIKQ